MDELLRAAARVANSQPTKQLRKRTQRDLESMINQHSQETEAGRAGKSITSSLFESQRQRPPEVDRRRPRIPDFEPDQVSLPPRAPPRLGIMGSLLKEDRIKRNDRFQLGTGACLNLFDPEEISRWADAAKPGILETWRKLKGQEMKWMATQVPRNAFEEMILWTEQGKLWKFPIDNEQGIEEEKNVSFGEHIFLDSWFDGLPEKGPVRQFMELFALGLSNNPYITVERKRQQFDWFKSYFEHNRAILDKAGVI